jgi:diguanylate cyclase (GGDEF)-like protein
MMSYSMFLGSILLASAGISFTYGLYASYEANKSISKKLVFIICCALSVWSLGLSITVAAANEKIAMIGHLLAPIGWGLLPGLLLHFTLILTGKEKIIKKWCLYLMLYSPGLVMLFAFTILPLMGKNADSFTYTNYGWVGVVNYDIWDYLYYVYSIGFMVVNLVVLFSTRKRLQDENKRYLLKVLAVGYIISYLLGTLSYIIPVILNITLPRYAVIFALIPCGAIGYAVNRNRTMDSEPNNRLFGNKGGYRYLYKVLGYGYAIASIFNFIYQKFAGIPNAYEFSLFLLISGVIILVVDNSKLNFILKEMLVVMVCSLSIPAITLRYIEYGSLIVWAFVVLLLFICILFNNRIQVYSIFTTSIMTQIMAMAIAPSVIVQVTMSHYLLGLIFTIISGALAIFVNNIYSVSIKENTYHNVKENLLYEITSEFISTEDWNKDEVLYTVLEKCGEFIKAENAYIVLYEKDLLKPEYICEWTADGAITCRRGFEVFDTETVPRVFKLFETEGVVKLHDTQILPQVAERFKKRLDEHNIRGMVSLPLKEKDRIIGMLGFNSSKPLWEWELDSSDFIEIVARMVSDMLFKIKTEEENKFLAYYDQVTKLPNRTLFKIRLQEEIENAEMTEQIIAVVSMDIDSFKSINDTMGHDIGDKVLLEVADILTKNTSDQDLVANFGGDEFFIMLNQLSDIDEAINIMHRLTNVICQPIEIDDREFFITVSAGVSLYPYDGENYEILINNANTAMYNAKELGKNQFLFCSKEMKDTVLEKMELTNKLYRAIEREQLVVYYQPQIDLETKNIVGFEALTRWWLPEEGIISPKIFIPLAEQTRLINTIGNWVLESACRQNRIWHEKGYPEMKVAVNISVHQLKTEGFVQEVKNIIVKTGLPPQYLELEVTESIFDNDADNLIDILTQLKALGVTITIDDFGIEYSSFRRLKSLPVDRIKLDIQFIRGIEETEKDRSVVRAIIHLAKIMGLKVIAEGVETKTQLDFLVKHSCDEVQGYYYYRPMPANEIEKIL